MARGTNEHFEIWGDDLEMPLIEDCGYNEWQVAERLSWHSHDGYELVLLLDGQASFEFRDGSRCDLAGGEYFFKLPGEVHRAVDDVTSPCKMFWIVFDLKSERARHNTVLTETDIEFLVQRYREGERKVFSYTKALQPLLDNLRSAVQSLHSAHRHSNRSSPDRGQGLRGSLFAQAPPFEAALLRTYICQLLLETAHQSLTGPIQKAGDFVAAAISYMESNYQEAIGVDEIAEHLGLSRSYLHAVFRRGTGQTPNDYLQRLRIKAAESMLTSGSSSVTEIASQLGFSSSQYFSRVFHKYTRQTPQEYRKARLGK